MERSFYNEDFDFEELIKQKSDQYKIYPSDKVWKGIHGSLHSSRKWYWFSFLLFMAGVSYYAVEQLSSPASKGNAVAGNKSVAATEPNKSNSAVVLPFTPPNIPYVSPKRKSGNDLNRGLVVVMNELVTRDFDPTTVRDQELEKVVTELAIAIPGRPSSPRFIFDNDFTVSQLSDKHKNEFAAVLDEKGDVVKELGVSAVNADDITGDQISSSNELADQKRINWLQENAVYELSMPKLKRASWQLYASPTMNYRKLVGNDNSTIASDVKNIPIALNIEGNVDNLVNHKPALGFEVGGAFLYAVNKNVTFKTGIQFNYSRYDIQAFSSYASERATIALSNFYGTNTDSITSFTRLGNFGGNTSKVLENQYFQFSTPVGVEVLVIGQGKLQFSVAGTIQPTYLLNKDSYLITTDYKNYTREPSLVRRWNVNAGAEAFLSYKAAGLRFQLGPQFRYQLLSTYEDKYPIKEYLMEYGIKLGVSKTIK